MNTSLNSTINFTTDTATLLIADPANLSQRVDEPGNWWIDATHKLPEVVNGQITFVALGGDGCYKVRVTTDKLKKQEQNYARAVHHAGLTVTNERFFVGAAEHCSGDGFNLDEAKLEAGEGRFIKLANNNYDLTIYAIDAQMATDDGRVSSSSRLADIVIVITERETAFVAPTDEIRFFYEDSDFLFPAKHQRGVLRMGVKIKVKVWKTQRTTCGKILKDSGDSSVPGKYYDYILLLEDMSAVNWRDEFTVKSVRVDEENKIIYCEQL